MKSQKVSFNNRDNIEIKGRIDLPEEGEPRAFALFAHCFTCNKNLNAVRNISKALNASGFGVLRFDFTGLGESDGDFAESNFSSNVTDLIDAADYLSKEYMSPSLLVGHSLGGAAAVFASAQIDGVTAYATIGAPSQPEHVSHFVDHKKDELKAHGEVEVNIGGRPFKVKKQFIDDIESKNAFAILRDNQKPILILHSPVDSIVSIDNATDIYKHARHPKSFISLDDADHLLSNEADSIYAGKVIATWAGRYL